MLAAFGWCLVRTAWDVFDWSISGFALLVFGLLILVVVCFIASMLLAVLIALIAEKSPDRSRQTDLITEYIAPTTDHPGGKYVTSEEAHNLIDGEWWGLPLSAHKSDKIHAEIMARNDQKYPLLIARGKAK
jgi:cell division protein FtsW (lipid II flippase)